MNIYAPLISALVTILLLKFLPSQNFINKVQDIPNQRSLHNVPVPRIGGIGLMTGVVSGWLMIFNSINWWVLLPLLGLFVVSLLDDVYNLNVRQRLLAHLLAAVVVVYGFGLFNQQGVIAALVIVLLIVWMVNLYNFMDGSDGLAGGMALVGFGMYTIAAWLAHNTELALLNLCVVSAAAGFLFYNFPPAKIFLGDAGSIPLGFLAGVMGILGWQQGCWPAWFPLMVFSPFIVDATVTLIKRTLHGEKITEAHRDHYYQRMIQLGWGHRNVAMAEYALMLMAGVTALLMIQRLIPWQTILVWCFIYAIVMYLLDMRWKIFIRGKNV